MRKAAIALALFAAATANPALAQDSAWRVSEVSGDVRAVVSGQSRPVTRGMLLASGSTIASGARARAVLVSGRDYVILSPASRVRLPAGVQQASGGSWAGMMTQIVSEAGTALYRIERRPNPHFRVQTPYLAAVVKGTVFTVTVTSSGASVQVTEGAVEVSTVDGGAAELVRPGMVATVQAGDLMELNIQGETSRSIRSSGTPLPGVATVPVADAGRYDGPGETLVEVTAPVGEDPVSLSDATDGLVSGQSGVDLALADLRNERVPGPPAPALPVDTSGPPVNTPEPPVDTPAPPAGEDIVVPHPRPAMMPGRRRTTTAMMAAVTTTTGTTPAIPATVAAMAAAMAVVATMTTAVTAAATTTTGTTPATPATVAAMAAAMAMVATMTTAVTAAASTRRRRGRATAMIGGLSICLPADLACISLGGPRH